MSGSNDPVPNNFTDPYNFNNDLTSLRKECGGNPYNAPVTF